LNSKPIPVYGDGLNVRDWLYVEDHCSAIYKILEKGRIGETYNIGGESEKTNLELVNTLCDIMNKVKPKKNFDYKSLITFVKDRPGHDRRYAINCDKIKNELKWKISVNFEEGIKKTVNWYLNNSEWINNIIDGSYMEWINKNYKNR
jgi:dTDP-glucose 4,6-dehydratase